MLNHIFNEFAILLSLSVLVGFVSIKLRQPLIFSFIVVGIIAGPSFLGWISAQSEIEILASFGITFLLFIVGLKLDVQLIRTFGSLVVMIGLGQIILTALIGSLFAMTVGMALLPALFVAAALTFSSTIIIIKVLSDRFEIDSLYGRISIGILIVQDLVVVIAIIVLSSLNINYVSYAELLGEIFSLILKGMGFLVLIGILMRFVFPIILEQIAKSRELLILFAISWAVILAVVATSLGFGKEVGGFLAGVSLASTKYREAIASRLETLRNLLLLFFFLNLGASLTFNSLGAEMIPAIVLSLFVLIGKPFIVMMLMGLMRFRKRTGFLTGLTMGQVSEFSLILAALGESLGYLSKDIEGLITLVALITIGLSTYMMAYSSLLYQWMSPWLSIFERDVKCREDDYAVNHEPEIDVLIYGFGRHGEHIAKILVEHGLKVMGIDFDPRKVRTWQHHHVLIRYGDAEDVEFSKSLPLSHVKWIVSTIPHHDANQLLVSSLKEMGYQGKIALSAYQENELNWMQKLDIDLIFVPYKDAALSAAERLVERILQQELRFT